MSTTTPSGCPLAKVVTTCCDENDPAPLDCSTSKPPVNGARLERCPTSRSRIPSPVTSAMRKRDTAEDDPETQPSSGELPTVPPVALYHASTFLPLYSS